MTTADLARKKEAINDHLKETIKIHYHQGDALVYIFAGTAPERDVRTLLHVLDKKHPQILIQNTQL